jgi:hypothetical protein
MLHPPHPWVAWLLQRNRRLVLCALFVLPFTLAAAERPEPPDQTTAAERITAAENFLNQRLFIWQKRLKLEDWTIVFKLVHLSDLKPKTLGNIHWDSDLKKANMSILCPADYKMTFADALKDMEFTIVHELVHLQLSSLPRNEASRSAEEKAVNTLTEALLNLDRRTQ